MHKDDDSIDTSTASCESSQHPELVEELGIPVLRTRQPLDPTVVADTLDAIRRERDLSVLGQR